MHLTEYLQTLGLLIVYPYLRIDIPALIPTDTFVEKLATHQWLQSHFAYQFAVDFDH